MRVHRDWLATFLSLLLICCGESGPKVGQEGGPPSASAGHATAGGSAALGGTDAVGGVAAGGAAGSSGTPGSGGGGGAIILDPFDVVTQGAAVDIYVDAADSPSVIRA